MKNNKLTKFQDTINKINARQNFTTNLSDTKNRYIVSYKNIYKGRNPSLFFELPVVLKKYIKSKMYDSMGGWLDNKTNLYYLDLNIHFSILETALKFAKQTNQIAIFDNLKKELIYLNNK